MPITKKTSSSEIIDDFVHSKNPKFNGKSKAERIRMALGAYYSKHPEKSTKNESDEHSDFMLHVHGAMSRKDFLKRKAEREDADKKKVFHGTTWRTEPDGTYRRVKVTIPMKEESHGMGTIDPWRAAHEHHQLNKLAADLLRKREAKKQQTQSTKPTNEEAENVMTQPTSYVDFALDKNVLGFSEAIGQTLSGKVSAALETEKSVVASKMFGGDVVNEVTGKQLHHKNQMRDMDSSHEHEWITALRTKHGGPEHTKVETTTAKNGSPIVSNIYSTKNKKKILVGTWDHKNAMGSSREAA